ncbi:MAG: lipid-A-disaccharide synthase [Vulcanimicrobiota bacterium]
MLTLAILSADPSGDLQAAALVEQLKQRHPDWRFVGVGGQHSRRVGVQLWSDSSLWSIVGLTEALTRVPRFVFDYWKVRQSLLSSRPALTIFIDSPAVHMRLAPVAQKAGLRCVYYFPPSGWSQNPRRLREIHDRVEALIPAFAYSAEQYRKNGLPVAYFGHPLVDLCQPIERQTALVRLGLTEGSYGALLPGSRTQEIRLLLPIFMETARRFPEMTWLLPTANPQLEARLRRALPDPPPWLRILPGSSREVMAVSRAGLLASGSATLEACLLDMPHLIGYRLNRLDWIIARLLNWLGLFNVPMFGLPNLVLQEKLIPEFLQDQLNPDTLERALRPLLQAGRERSLALENLARVRQRLGLPGAVRRVAEFVEKMALGQTRDEALA